MSQDRYQHMKAVYQAAVELPWQERQEYVQRVCDGDDSLRDDVMTLLHAEAQASRFLETPVLPASHFQDLVTQAQHAADDPLPVAIGRYRIIRVIGEGGMGRVFEAQQDAPRRTVALKVMRAGLPSRRARDRFEREIEILGRLHHEGIARIYEAGFAAIEGGHAGTTLLPFFAMELVQGVDLARYNQSHALSDRDRLRLLAEIADAVHHGHLQGIVHRDLKPGNVLVTAEGRCKVIDFGVALATDIDLKLTTQTTESGQVIGTLAYMSPEQIAGNSSAIDGRSDVYSLGVLGYELLSGRLPYELADRQAADIARIIRDQEPSRMSTISRIYRGDIETIFAKALEKDRQRRYESAADFAADLRRYLAHEPIQARPPSLKYQAIKFVRRHRELAAGLALLVLAIVCGVVGIGIALSRAMVGQQEAARQTDNVQAVNQFLVDMLASANPESRNPADLTVRETLDQAAARLQQGDFADRPLIAATVHTALGKVYHALSQYQQAATHLKEARRIRLDLLGSGHPDTLEVTSTLASTYKATMDYPASIELLQEVLQSTRQGFGDGSLETAAALTALGDANALALRYEAAEPLLNEALRIRKQLLPQNDERIQTTRLSLARLQFTMGNIIKAEKMYADALKILRNAASPDSLQIAAVQTERANLLILLGKLDNAEDAGREAVEIYKGVYGSDHALVMTAEGWLALALQAKERFDEAEPMVRHTMEVARQVHGEDSPVFIGPCLRMGGLELMQGRLAESRAWYERALDLAEKLEGPQRPLATAAAELGLGQVLLQQGDAEAARDRAQRTVELRRSNYPSNSPAQAPPLTLLASAYVALRQSVLAEAAAREALAIREMRTPEHWQVEQLRSVLGEALVQQDRFDEGEPLLIESCRALVAAPYVPHRERLLAIQRVAQAYQMAPRQPQAELWAAAYKKAQSSSSLRDFTLPR